MFKSSARLWRSPRRPTTRQFSLDSLSHAYLDLAIALPFPPDVPAYSATIIAVTVATRLFFTVPVSIWAKKRQWRAEEIVLPITQQYGKQLRSQIAAELRSGTVRDKEAFIRERENDVRKSLSAKRKELFSEFKCSPIPTMLAPQLVQLPLFILTSLVIQHACVYPSPLDSESFFTITSLVYPDRTNAFPIAVGVLSLANVETAKWLVGGEQAREMLRREEAQRNKDKKDGVIRIRPQLISKSLLRGLSIVRIVIGSLMPGAVIIYWTSSAAFSLIQSWVFDFWEGRRKKRLAQVKQEMETKLALTPPGSQSSDKTASKFYWER